MLTFIFEHDLEQITKNPMKQLLLLLIVFIPLMTKAQNKQSVVTLKSGTELKGIIKSIDPLDALVIVIAGVETTIKMADVARIEEEESRTVVVSEPQTPQLSPNAKLVVTDMAEYPDSFTLKVFDTEINMILVRGGDMNMGFDGDNSMEMKSEPVHKVTVTSFYISDTFIPSILAQKLTDKKINTKWPYHEDRWQEVNDMIAKISLEVGMPLRLPLEAEWEYAACSKQQKQIFTKCSNNEFCFDFFADFEKLQESVIDPTGPESGKRHVARYYGDGNEKFDRGENDLKNHFRLVMKAKNIKQLKQ